MSRGKTASMLLASLIIVMVAFPASADSSGTWTRAADMPGTRSSHGMAMIEDKIYLVGGLETFVPPVASVWEIIPIATVWIYDLTTGEWSFGAPMPTPRSGLAVAAVDGKIYAAGGLNLGTEVYAAVEIYDPATDSWTSGTDMPTARWGAAVAVLHGLIYVIGGSTDINGGLIGGLQDITAVVEVYNPANDSWNTVKDMVVPRALAAAATKDSRVWVSGGYSAAPGEGGFLEVSSALTRYDPTSDEWKVMSRLHHPRWGHSMVVIADSIYAIGGTYSSRWMAVDTVERFWGTRWEDFGSTPAGIVAFAAAADDKTAYLSGGWSGIDLDSLLTFNPALHTYWADIVAHFEGSYSSVWRTDIAAINDHSQLADVVLVLHSGRTPGTMITTIDADSQLSMEDVVGQMGINGKGMLEVRSTQPLRISGRTYSVQGGGTFGQLCEIQSPDRGLKTKGWLIGLRQKVGEYRTNLTFANSGLWEGSVNVQLYSQDGTELADYTVSLKPGEIMQDLQPFESRAGLPNLGWGYAIVTPWVSTGLFVSASVIDSRTNDATTIFPKK